MFGFGHALESMAAGITDRYKSFKGLFAAYRDISVLAKGIRNETWTHVQLERIAGEFLVAAVSTQLARYGGSETNHTSSLSFVYWPVPKTVLGQVLTASSSKSGRIGSPHCRHLSLTLWLTRK